MTLTARLLCHSLCVALREIFKNMLQVMRFDKSLAKNVRLYIEIMMLYDLLACYMGREGGRQSLLSLHMTKSL